MPTKNAPESAYSTLTAYERACPYEVEHERLHALANVRVMYIDRDAILTDFPWLTGKNAPETMRNILGWAKSMGAVSSEHFGGSQVNAPLSGTGETRNVIRPPRYGRACIVDSAESSGMEAAAAKQRRLCDLKGCGIRPGYSPKAEAHSTGLLTLVEAFVEVTNRKFLARIFKKSRLDYQCLPFYAVLDLGFKHDGVYEKQARSALLIRRAHFRPKNNNEIPMHGTPKQAAIREIELHLNHYCMTSVAYDVSFVVNGSEGQWSGSFAKRPVEGLKSEHISRLAAQFGVSLPNMFHLVNVQMADDSALSDSEPMHMLVDFSHYCFTDFLNGYVEVVPADDKPLNFGFLRQIAPPYGQDSERYKILKQLDFFTKKALDESCRGLFGEEKMKKSYSAVVKFSHELIAEIDGKELPSPQIDERISEFVNLAIG